MVLTREEFVEWIAFTRVEGPLGRGRDDLYAMLQSSGKSAGEVLPWLNEYVDPDEKPAVLDVYIPTEEERAWMASLGPRENVE